MANRQQDEEGTSAGNGRELFLDTQGACFLCLQDPSSGGDEDCSENGGIGLEEVSLRDICRYLGIRGLGKSSLKGRGGGSTEFVVDLCGKCGDHVNQLSEKILVLEEAERGIAKELQEIQGVLKGCLEREECQLQWEKILENNPIDIRIIEYLREETDQKGSEKLKILTATKTTPPTGLKPLGKSAPGLNPSGMRPETPATSCTLNITAISASSTTLLPASVPTSEMLPSSDPPYSSQASASTEIIFNGSCSQIATRTTSISKAPPTELNRAPTKPSSSLSPAEIEPETATTSSTPNLTSMSTTLSAPLPNSISISEVPISPSSDPGSPIRSQTATRATSISKAPPTRLTRSSTRTSSKLNRMDGVNGVTSPGNEMALTTVSTSTHPNSSAAMASTSPTSPSTDLDSSDEESSVGWRIYRGPAVKIFSRSYESQKKNGVMEYHCHHCKHLVKKNSAIIRRHIISQHPEVLFTNVNRLSNMEFKKCVKKFLWNELILKSDKSSYQCELCKLSFQKLENYRYHLVMSHYSILEKKLRRLQEAVVSETDEAEESVAVEKEREELSLSEGRVEQGMARRARFECLVWSGGCGKIFSKVESLRMHEKACKGRVTGGTLNLTPMREVNPSGSGMEPETDDTSNTPPAAMAPSAAPSKRYFQCSECQRKCSTKKNLKKHMRIKHTGERGKTVRASGVRREVSVSTSSQESCEQ